jgi:hypothetical protein
MLKLLQIHFNTILPLTAMIYKKSLSFRIDIQIVKGTWHTQYNTKQHTVKCNFTLSVLEQYMD